MPSFSIPTALAAGLGVLAAAFAGGAASAQTIQRAYPSPTAFLASSVLVPAGADTLYVSGMLASGEAMKGGTEAQADSILGKIEAELKSRGMGLGDVVMMRAYLVGDPAKGGAMDFAGWQAAYLKRFGTAAQPNRPARAAVQVAKLAAPTALIEVEVTAARAKP